jgi:hypothetical protein
MLTSCSFRDLVLVDLLHAQELVRVIDDPGGIDPQFHIFSPEGEYWIAPTLSDDIAERSHQLQLMQKFMAWKRAVGFTLAAETKVPEGVFCLGIAYHGRLCAISTIVRNPLRFSPVHWLDRWAIDEELLALLPQGEITLDADSLAELEEYFGFGGKFPAIRLS